MLVGLLLSGNLTGFGGSIIPPPTPDSGGGGGGGGIIRLSRRGAAHRKRLRLELEAAILEALSPSAPIPAASEAIPATPAPEPVSRERVREAIRQLPIFQQPTLDLGGFDLQALALTLTAMLREQQRLATEAANDDDEEAMFLIKLAML